MTQRYWLHTALIALLVLLAFDLAQFNSQGLGQLPLERIEDIAIGCALALLGTAAALALVWFLQSRFGALGSEMLSGVALQRRDWFLLLLLPLSFALLATFAARVTVLRALGRTL